ncbi:MAG: hypothetical protein ED555_10495 [Allomuricauda sp.]|nr:MAG: hypothetical protein ED555_10495 [Allomuricauda sp.]
MAPFRLVWGFFLSCREAMCKMKGFSSRNLGFLFFVSLFLVSASCEKKADENITDATQKDSVTIWVDRVKDNKHLPLEHNRAILEKALHYTNEILPDSLKTKKYSQISLAYKRIGDTLNFKKFNQELIQLALANEDYQSLGEAYWDLGVFYKLSVPDSSFYFYNEAYESFLKADLSQDAQDYPGRMQYAISLLKDNNKDYVGAGQNAVNAINYYRSNNIDESLFNAYTRLANIEAALDNFTKALEYHKIATSYLEKSQPNKQFNYDIFNRTNIAYAHSESGNYSVAKEILIGVLETDSLRQKDSQIYAKTLASLAKNKLKNGDQNLDSIINLITVSNKILDNIGDIFSQARNREFMAWALIAKSDTLGAIKQAVSGKEIAQATNNNDRLLSTLQLLTQIDKENSAEHAKAYHELSESLQNQERNIRDKFARIQMETDEVIKENEALARQKQLWLYAAVAILLFALAIYIIVAQRAKNQKLRFEQEQQESDQKIYNLMLSQQAKFQEGKQMEQKRVSEELHDGILGQMLGIRLILSGLNERNDESAIVQRAELIEKLQELEEEIRTISHELNEASYQKMHNFILAIDDLVTTTGASAQLQSSFSHDEKMDWDALDGETKINIYRVIQECLQNCIKHAHCEKVEVDFKSNGKSLLLTVSDNGRGFDNSKGKKGIGMKNIMSRVTKMSGVFKVDSALGKGTTIMMTLPQPDRTSNISRAKAMLEV